MPKKKKENLVHVDIDELSKKTPQTKAIPTSLGQILTAYRKKKSLDIEDVAATLCIKPIYLTALEEGHYYAFPAQSYAIGFLRSYARYLKLDPDEMVALYHQEASNIKEEPIDMLVIEKHLSLPKFKTVCIVLGCVALIYAIWYMVATNLDSEMFVRNATLNIINKTATTEEETTVSIQETQLNEFAEVSEEVYISPVAFVAIDQVWVSIKDAKNNKVLLDKVFVKNEHYIPTIPLEDLTVSTGRDGMLDLYVNGQRIKTFDKEEDTSLAEFAPAE